MQHTTTLVLTGLSMFASVVLAQVTEAPSQITAVPSAASCTLAELIPECGRACISSAAIAAGCAGPADHACQCSQGPQMQAVVRPCVMSACGTVTAPIVGSIANAICTECAAHQPTATASP